MAVVIISMESPAIRDTKVVIVSLMELKKETLENMHIPKKVYPIKRIENERRNSMTLTIEILITSYIRMSFLFFLNILKMVIQENRHPRPMSLSCYSPNERATFAIIWKIFAIVLKTISN